MLPLYDFKHPRRSPQRGGHEPHLTFRNDDHADQRSVLIKNRWWSLSGSNRRPEACKATALPAELRPLYWFGLRRRRKHPLSWLPAPWGAAGARRPVGLAVSP